MDKKHLMQIKKEKEPKINYDTVPLKPQETIKEIMEAVTPTTIVSTDVGQNQMWMAHTTIKQKIQEHSYHQEDWEQWDLDYQQQWEHKLQNQKKMFWAVVGDGGFQMVSQELATIKRK